MSRNSRYIFYSKSFMIQVFNPFWFAFCVWYKIVVQSHSFACGCIVYQQHLSKRLLCPLCIVGSLGTYVSQSVSSVTQSCLTLCDPMNRSTPDLPVHHQLLEFTHTHAHQVGDAIQPSHPLSPPSPPAPNPSQHQGLCQWVSSSHEVAKLLEFQLQHQYVYMYVCMC